MIKPVATHESAWAHAQYACFWFLKDWDHTFVSKKWQGTILSKSDAAYAGCVIGVCIVERARAICPLSAVSFCVCTW